MPGSADEGFSLLAEARRHYDLGRFGEALQTLAHAQDLFRERADLGGLCDALVLAGRVHQSLNDYPRAVASHEEALGVARRFGDAAREGAALLHLGNAHALAGRAAEADECRRGALSRARETGDSELEVLALEALLSAPESAEHVRYFEQSMRAWAALRGRAGAGDDFAELFEAAHGVGPDEDGGEGMLRYQRLRRDIARALGDHEGEALALELLGGLYHRRGDYAGTLDSYEQGLQTARRHGLRVAEGRLLGLLGRVALTRGEYLKALDYHERHLELAQASEDRAGEAAAHDNLADVLLLMGEFDRSTEHRQLGKEIRRELETVEGGNAPADATLAAASLAAELLAAESLAAESLAGALRTDASGGAKAADGPESSVEYWETQLLEAQRRGDRVAEASLLGLLAELHSRRRDYARAVELYNRWLDILRGEKNRQLEATALTGLGLQHLMLGDYDRANEYVRRSAALARELGNSAFESQAMTILGHGLAEAGDLAGAEEALRSAVALYDSLRSGLRGHDAYQVSTLDMQAHTYMLLQHTLVAAGKFEEALEAAEAGRARAFAELLAARLREGRAADEAEEAAASPTVEQIRRIAADHRATVVEYSIFNKELFREPREGGQREAWLYVWAVRPTGEIDFRQVEMYSQGATPARDERLVAGTRRALGLGARDAAAKGRAAGLRRLRRLHRLLVEPVEHLLPADPEARVVFVPQGAFFLAPFAALLDRTGRHLVEKHTVITAPSIQLLDLTRRRRAQVSAASTEGALVVGNPTMPSVPAGDGGPGVRLSPLPHAEEEAAEVARLLGTRALVGAHATRAEVVSQMPRRRVIHLATHGLLDALKGGGVPGAVALAPSADDDGWLLADQILDMKLAAELVVLSACETGQGRLTGDGVIGLSRSLIAAGASSVVVSLWSVPDAPTSYLMKCFHQELAAGRDKAAALRRAMLSTMKLHPHPRDWAAFVLIGEAE